MVFHWSLSDSKSPQVFRALLSILAILNKVLLWIVSTRPPTSKSSSPFSNPLVTVPNAPITIGIIVTYMFHSFFNSLARSTYLSLFQFYSVVSRDSKVDNVAISLFLLLLIIIRSALLAKIRLSVCMSKPRRELMCVIFYDKCWVVHIPFVRMVKFKFLAHLPVEMSVRLK